MPCSCGSGLSAGDGGDSSSWPTWVLIFGRATMIFPSYFLRSAWRIALEVFRVSYSVCRIALVV